MANYAVRGVRRTCGRWGKRTCRSQGRDSYKFSASPAVYEINDPHVPTIRQLLRILRESLIDLYGDEQANYEALFYALRAAIDGKEARTRDPSTIYFWRGISAAIESLPISAEKLLDFLYEAEAYIYHVVWESSQESQLASIISIVFLMVVAIGTHRVLRLLL